MALEMFMFSCSIILTLVVEKTNGHTSLSQE